MAATLAGSGRVESAEDSEDKADVQPEVAALQAQVTSLQRRLELLEHENQMLLTRLSSCRRCSKFGVTRGGISQECDKSDELSLHETAGIFKDIGSRKHIIDTTKDEIQQLAYGYNEADNYRESGEAEESREHILAERLTGGPLRISYNPPKRYVALKIVYFGQRFYGFSSEAQKEPTVESEMLKALAKTRLLVGDKHSLCYSRCGRTDKGVSSTGQVISLYLRSKVASGENIGSEQNTYDQEIDYVKVLNKVLPKDIRISGWSAVSPEFHARFGCLCREYKYFFWRGSLDLVEMKISAKKFVGIHDFRNFCKMDAANVKNYTRKIISFEISPCSKISNDDEIWAMTIKGSAFLWHQVRCMVAVLFMIGEGHESSNVIDLLLDISKSPRKPQYSMASELPLVLRTCEFKGLKFVCTSDAKQALCDDLREILQRYLLQAAIVREALDCLSAADHASLLKDCKKKRRHIPLMMRPTEPSYEERCAKMDKKAKRPVQALQEHLF